MKRVFALALCLCLLALNGVTALAAQDLLTITGPEGGNTVAPGSTVVLTFGVAANSNISALNVEVTWDTDTFEFVQYTNGDVLNNAMAAGNNVDGKFLFAMAVDPQLTEAGSLFTIEFRVDSKATGDHTFYLYSTACGDINGADIPVNRTSKVLTVSGKSVSDVSVTPVYSTDENNSQVVVSADNGESATGVQVGSKAAAAGTSADESSVWVIVGVVAVTLIAIGLLATAAILKAKKGPKEPEEHQSILDADAKALLDMTPDALKNEDKNTK